MRKITVEEIEILVTAKVDSLRPQLRKVVKEVKGMVEETKSLSADMFKKIDINKVGGEISKAKKQIKKELGEDFNVKGFDTSIKKTEELQGRAKELSDEIQRISKLLDNTPKGEKFDGLINKIKELNLEFKNLTKATQKNDAIGFEKYNATKVQNFIDNNKINAKQIKTPNFNFATTNNAVKQLTPLKAYLDKFSKYKLNLGNVQVDFTKFILQVERAKQKVNELKKNLKETSATKLNNSIQQIKKSITASGTGSKKISSGLNSAKNTASKMAGKLKVGLGQILKIAGALFSLQSIYSTLSNVANTWLSSQNSQAKQLSANIEYMKYALGSTLAPVIQWIVNLIYQALKGVQSLIYALTGVNIFANASAKAYSNMAKSANSAKKATDSLAPGDIDEVHNIQEDRSSGGSGAGDVMPNIDLGQVNTKLNDFLKMIKEGKWYEAGSIIGKKINESLEKIPWDSIKKTAGNIGKGIAEFINGGIASTDWNLVGKTLAEGLNTGIRFLESFITTMDWGNLADSMYRFLKGIVTNIDYGSIARTLFFFLGARLGMQVKTLWISITDISTTIGDYFSKKIQEAGGNVALGLWNGIIEGLGDIAQWIYDNIIKPFVDGFKNGMGIHSPSTVMADLGKNVIEGLIKGIKDKISNLSYTVSDVCGSIKTWFSEKIASSKFVQTGKNVIEGVKEGLNNNPIYSTISGICGNVRTWFSDNLGSWNFTNIGKNVIEGIKRGMNSAKTSLASTASTIAASIATKFKSTLGIHSPSKVMADYVGKFIPLGIAEGIKSQAQSVYDSVYEITNGLKLNKQGLVTDISATYSKSNINSNLLSGKSIIEKATNNTNSNSGGTINFENILKLNGKTVAREIIEDLDTEARRRGYKPLLQR